MHARIATAGYVIVNGLGYDTWASDLVGANPVDRPFRARRRRSARPAHGRQPPSLVLPRRRRPRSSIASLPTTSPSIPPTRRTTTTQRARYTGTALRPYHDAIAQIRAQYAGTPVGASESIVDGLAARPGSTSRHRDASSTRSVKATIPSAGRQGHGRPADRHPPGGGVHLQQPERHARRAAAGRRGSANDIPVVTVTETPVPAGATSRTGRPRNSSRSSTALAQGGEMSGDPRHRDARRRRSRSAAGKSGATST